MIELFRFRVLGVDIVVGLLAILQLALFAWVAFVYIRKNWKHSSEQTYWRVGIVAAIALFLTVVAHEAAHAAVSAAFGYPITEAGVTMLGAYVRPSGSFSEMSGVAQILIAFAGPFANIVIFALAWLVVKYLDESLFENSVQFLAYMNGLLAMLNLIPFPGLDGHKVLSGILVGVGITNPAVGDTIGIVATVLFIGLGGYRFLDKSLEKHLETL